MSLKTDSSRCFTLKKYNTLGLQSPGLQIYCPLNQNIVFLLVDLEFYHIEFSKNQNGTGIIYVNKKSDIDAINKLQRQCSESSVNLKSNFLY
jgi:hypothetical protein